MRASMVKLGGIDVVQLGQLSAPLRRVMNQDSFRLSLRTRQDGDLTGSLEGVQVDDLQAGFAEQRDIFRCDHAGFGGAILSPEIDPHQ